MSFNADSEEKRDLIILIFRESPAIERNEEEEVEASQEESE